MGGQLRHSSSPLLLLGFKRKRRGLLFSLSLSPSAIHLVPPSCSKGRGVSEIRGNADEEKRPDRKDTPIPRCNSKYIYKKHFYFCFGNLVGIFLKKIQYMQFMVAESWKL